MLKLILADDEEMIRESIRALIDWDSIGVEVVASCKWSGNFAGNSHTPS